MIGALIQAHLLRVLHTGDPMVDTLLTTLLLTMVSYAMMHKAAVVNWLKRLLWFPSAVEQGSSITVYDTDEAPPYINYSYQALMWYLTSKVPTPTGGEATLFKGGEGGRETFVTSNKRAVEHNGHAMTMQSAQGKEGQVVRRRIIVAAKGEVLPLIREFVEEVHRQHADHIKSALWEQSMYRMMVKNTGLTCVAWTPQKTHSTKTFNTVVLGTDIKKRIVADFRGFLSAEKWYADMGLPYKRSYLFHGPPGTGKTSMVLAMSNESKRNIYRLDLSRMDSDNDLDKAFESMPSNCVVMLEDVDCASTVTRARCSPLSSFPEPSKDDTFTLSALLNHLDGVSSNHGRIFVMTSNHPEVLDPALVRPGRVDMSVYLGRCCADQIRKFYELYFETGSDIAGCTDKDKHKLRLDEVRPDVLTPAEVSNVLLYHRADPRAAVDELIRISSRAAV